MYVRGYLQGSENGRVVTIVNNRPPTILQEKCKNLFCTGPYNCWKYENDVLGNGGKMNL